MDNKKTKYGILAATMFGISSMIGSGIFLLPARLYVNLGPASILTVFIDIVIVLLFAFCFAEAAGYVDNKNGGAYQYSKLAFGELAGYSVGFLGWVSCVIGWSAMAMGFSELFLALFPNLVEITSIKSIIAVILIVSLSIVNNFGNRISKYIGSTIYIAKLIPLITFSIATIFFIKYGIVEGNFTPFIQLPENTSIIEGLTTNALILFYGFIGFETLPIIANEVYDSQKNLPKAVILSTLIVSGVYFLIILGTIAMLGTNTASTNPVQQAFSMMIGPIGGLIVSIGAIISVGGLNNISAVSIPRMAQTLADDGLLPKKMSLINKWESPYFSAIITAIIACSLVITGSFEKLVGLTVLMFFVQYIPTAFAVVKFKTNPTFKKIQEGFNLPFGITIPVLAIIFSFLILASSAIKDIIFLICAVILSIILYFITNKNKQ